MTSFSGVFLFSDNSEYSPNKFKLKPTVHIYKLCKTITPLGNPSNEKWCHSGHLSQPTLKSLYTTGSSGSAFLQLPHK